MIFASPIFLFLFLPIFLAVYYITPARFRSAFILLGSSFFYAWWRLDFLALLYLIIMWSWLIALAIERWHFKSLLWLGVGANLLTLGYFKYWNFGIESLQQLGVPVSSQWLGVVLPIAISFFVFHAISYIVDVWRRDTAPTRNLFDFAAFISLFPHLIAGPVLRYKDLATQFTSRTHSMSLFSEGAYRFMAGFSMKVLIADAVAPLADSTFALEVPAQGDAWLGATAYTIQLFFDFAGYSAMAVGLALMMGFRFIENFNHPYTSRSITEFWQRWHISLSTWLRDYLYIPLGGNRKGAVRLYINLMITMLLGGLWHGANITFVLWGAWHGLWLCFERAGLVLPRWLGFITTLLIVILGWVMFRAHSLDEAMVFYHGMAGLNGVGISADLAWQIKYISVTALVAGTGLVFAMPHLDKYRTQVMLSKGSYAVKTTPLLVLQIIIAILFLLSVTRLLAMSYSPFLYFQF